MPKQSAKRLEVAGLDDDELVEELGEAGWEPEPEPGKLEMFLRELEKLADQLRLPVDTLQRIQVAAILTLVRETQKLREAISELRVTAPSGGTGFDAQRFRDLIKRDLGTDIDDETLRRAFRIAGDPARLERAVSSVQKSMASGKVESPVAFLMYTLNKWRDQDRKRR